MTTSFEKDRALRESCNAVAADEYFTARLYLCGTERERIFDHGFQRGWDAANTLNRPCSACGQHRDLHTPSDDPLRPSPRCPTELSAIPTWQERAGVKATTRNSEGFGRAMQEEINTLRAALAAPQPPVAPKEAT